jgi:cytochrome o ubiquinol oxidase operon protein cyoD
MENHEGLLKSYITGFILSIVLTLVAFSIVMLRVNLHDMALTVGIITTVILILAFIQLIIQLVFFLHLIQEPKPRWKLYVFISFIGIILIVVTASIWIMQHLNYNMSLVQFNNLMQYGEGF